MRNFWKKTFLHLRTQKGKDFSSFRLLHPGCSKMEIITVPGRTGSWWGNRRERDRWGDLGVGGWIILGWISRRLVVGMGTGLG